MTNNCGMCGVPEEGHEGRRHPFTPEGVDAGTDWLKQKQTTPEASAAPQPQMSSFPFDPVLRLALINKGVLTPDDLTQAEQQIKAIGGALNGN
jgi:hypothetical protein